MEDIALRYLNPQQYYRIANLMHKRAEREQYIDNVIVCIREKLDEMGIQADLSGRPKHIYSVFKKMTVKNKQFNEIYDLLAIRIIVDNIKDCYATLGIIHTLGEADAWPFQKIISPCQNEYVSISSYDGGRTEWGTDRGSDPDLGDASYGRVRYRGSLVL